MPHSPLVTSEILTQGHAAHVLAFDRHHGVGQFLNYLTLLLGIEYVLDEMNFYQWHCRSPRWYSSLGLMAASPPGGDDVSCVAVPFAKTLKELQFFL
jgi:hypothetical protein